MPPGSPVAAAVAMFLLRSPPRENKAWVLDAAGKLVTQPAIRGQKRDGPKVEGKLVLRGGQDDTASLVRQIFFSCLQGTHGNGLVCLV